MAACAPTPRSCIEAGIISRQTAASMKPAPSATRYLSSSRRTERDLMTSQPPSKFPAEASRPKVTSWAKGLMGSKLYR